MTGRFKVGYEVYDCNFINITEDGRKTPNLEGSGSFEIFTNTNENLLDLAQNTLDSITDKIKSEKGNSFAVIMTSITFDGLIPGKDAWGRTKGAEH